MNKEKKSGSWASVKKDIHNKFTKFSENEIEEFNGHLDKLSEKVQKRYGYDKIRADKECKEFVKKS